MAAKRIAIITGATQGIGLAAATSLAKDHGYHVIIAARNATAATKVVTSLQDSGHSASALQVDISSDMSIRAASASVSFCGERLWTPRCSRQQRGCSP